MASAAGSVTPASECAFEGPCCYAAHRFAANSFSVVASNWRRALRLFDVKIRRGTYKGSGSPFKAYPSDPGRGEVRIRVQWMGVRRRCVRTRGLEDSSPACRRCMKSNAPMPSGGGRGIWSSRGDAGPRFASAASIRSSGSDGVSSSSAGSSTSCPLFLASSSFFTWSR